MRASSLNTTAEGFRVHSLTAASLRWALGAICAIALLAGVTQSNGYAQLKLETPAAGEGGDGDPESSTDDPNKMPPEQAFRRQRVRDQSLV